MSSEARFALFVLFGINFMNFFDRQVAGALSEPIRKEFQLSDTTLGIVATAFTLVYALVGVPLGRLADRFSRTRIVALGVATWSLFTAASGAAMGLGTFVAARMGVGIGEASCAPASQSLLADLFPASHRARAMGVFMLGLPLGIFAAYTFAGIVGSAWGFRAAFYAACVPGLVLALLVLRIREPARGGNEATLKAASAPRDIERPYRAVLSIPTMWWIIGSGLLFNFHIYAINIFQTPFLQRYHELGLKDAARLSGISLGLTGVIGLMGGGFLGDRMRLTRPNGRLVLAAVTMLAAVPCTYFALVQPRGATPSFAWWMGTASALSFVYYATVYASIQDVVPPSLRATAVSLYFFAMYVLGGAFGSTVLGALSDHFAARAAQAQGIAELTPTLRADGLHHAMFIMPVLLFLCALTLFGAARTFERDATNLRPDP